MIKIMKQTAVEWLIENVLLQPTTKEEVEHNISIFKIAKELEKKQIIDDYIAGAGGSVYAYKEFAQEYLEDNYGTQILSNEVVEDKTGGKSLLVKAITEIKNL